jgi:putative heme-binding domain-containing protein
VLERQQQIEGLRSAEDIYSAVKHLIAIDGELRDAEFVAKGELRKSILVALAEHRTPVALEHLRAVFETQTSRRHHAAYAISLAALQRPTNDQDWRYLVRSLTIVEGEQAVSVLKALRKFRLRATKSTWVREVILIGLQLPDAELPVALGLLKFWSGHSVDESVTVREQLKQYQDWFSGRYADQPAATLPVDAPMAKWTFEKLAICIADLPRDETSLTLGAVVYSKANCNKCHRRDGIAAQPADDRLGPNLSSLGWRRQPKEVVSAILYPSHRLNDEYPVTIVALQSGKTVSGLLMPTKDGGLMVVGADSKETVFEKEDVEETVTSNVSNMPAGLLETLSEEEVRNLFAFLTAQSGDYDPHRP